jgi:hypothetical protein
MENASDLFDPKRLHKLWERSAEGSEPGEQPGVVEPPKEEPEPARVALENMEASVRRKLGARAKPLEPLLKKARELVLAQLAKERAEREAEEAKKAAEAAAAAAAAAAEAAAAAGEPPPEQAPAETPAEAPPQDATASAPPAEPGPRKAVKKQKGPMTAAPKGGHKEINTGDLENLGIDEVDESANALHAAESARERDISSAAYDDVSGGGGTTEENLERLGSSEIEEALNVTHGLASAREHSEALADRIAPAAVLSEADLLKNVATLGQLLDLIEDVYRAQLLVK